MNRAQAHFVECGGHTQKSYTAASSTGVAGEYPTLRAVADQADPGLTQTTAIANLTDLENMANNLTGNYYLTGDIDASATSGGGYNGGKGWEPIGTGSLADTTFTGTFDGCGYTISNLYINDNTEIDVGLFGAIRTPAVIANLTLADCDITGNRYVGTIAGRTTLGDVYNCHSSGTVTLAGSNPFSIGGMVGYNGTTIISGKSHWYDCSTSCTVDGSAGRDVGGFIGSAGIDSYYHNCSATGNVTGGGSGRVGGFVGANSGVPAGNFDDCSATGDVSGPDECGGFVGWNNGGFCTRCSATGNVTATDADGIAGGFSGTAGNTYTDCYAWGNVTGGATTGRAGGFSGTGGALYYQCYSIGTTTAQTDGGFAAVDGSMYDCYWDGIASGDTTSGGAVGGVGYDFEGKSTAWLKDYTGFPASWDYDTIWYNPYVAGETVEESWTETDIGYTHLMGETVSILADGTVYPDQVVSDSGTIDETEFSTATEVHVGLKYTSKLRPMKPVSQPDMMKKIVTCKQMGLSVHNADDSNDRSEAIANSGLRYGVDDDAMKEIDFADAQWKNKSDIDGLFTGSVAVNVPDGFSVNLPLQLIIDSPLPCTIRAMIPKTDYTGT